MRESDSTFRITLLIAALMTGACKPGPEPPDGSATQRILVPLTSPAGPGAMAPNLTAGANGVYLSWLQPDDPAERRSFRLWVARLEGGTWRAPAEVAAGEAFFANWADLPAVAEGDGGELVGHWLEKLGDETYAYGVQLARAAGDGGWQRVGLLHDDTSSTEHGFVSYVPSADGIHAFWLDGRAMADGGAMQLRTALLDGGTLPASTLLDERVCECCSTDAALTSAGPIVAFRDRGPDETRNVAVVRATAGGWSAPRAVHDDGWRIHGCPVNGPAVDADGERVALAWFTMVDEEPRVQVAFSTDAGATFGAPVLVDGARPLGRVDLALDGGGNAFVCWLGSAGEGAEVRVRRVTPAGETGPVRVIAETTAKRSAGVPRMARDGDRLIFAWVEDRQPSGVAVAARSLTELSSTTETR